VTAAFAQRSMITSLSEFLAEIDNLKLPNSDVSSTTLPWYRGQGDESWHLIPSIYRGDWDPAREREMTRDFRLRAHMEVEHRPNSYLGWLFVMQHYGLPTRLLDWTESCLVALYFAVENFANSSNATVWVMHPRKLNENAESYGQSSVPPLSADTVKKYALPMDTIPTTGQAIRVEKDMPMAVRLVHTTRRIVAQRGQFTIHGHRKEGLDQMGSLNLNLKKLVIDGKQKLPILRQLFKASVFRYSLFPDTAGLATEISVRYSKKFMK
jgi:hypothetical protein